MILHTEQSGSGEPIVFLHTGLQTGLTDFTTQREHFQDNFNVIAPDLRGHGQTVSDDLANYFHDSATDLHETLLHLNIEAAHIVGCSLGALVGLVFAKKCPTQVLSLTLSGITPKKPENWAEIIAEDMAHQARMLKNEEVTSYFDQVHTGDWRKTLDISQVSDWYPFDETGDLSMLKMPVLYLVGEGHAHEKSGTLIYPETNENIHVAIIPFASHNVHLEQPEIYTQIVETFIKKTNE